LTSSSHCNDSTIGYLQYKWLVQNKIMALPCVPSEPSSYINWKNGHHVQCQQRQPLQQHAVEAASCWGNSMSIGCCLQQTSNVISQTKCTIQLIKNGVPFSNMIFFLQSFHKPSPNTCRQSTVKKRAPIMLEWKKQEWKLNALSLTNIGPAFHTASLLLHFPCSHFWPYHIFHSRIFSHPDKNCDRKNKHNYKHGMPKPNIGTCIMKYRQYYANKYQYQWTEFSHK